MALKATNEIRDATIMGENLILSRSAFVGSVTKKREVKV